MISAGLRVVRGLRVRAAHACSRITALSANVSRCEHRTSRHAKAAHTKPAPVTGSGVPLVAKMIMIGYAHASTLCLSQSSFAARTSRR